mgnify:CR=1 FL=1
MATSMQVIGDRTKADGARAWGKLKRAGSGKQKETRPKEHTFPMSPAADDSNFLPLSHPPSFAFNSLWLFRRASWSPPLVKVIAAMTRLMQIEYIAVCHFPSTLSVESLCLSHLQVTIVGVLEVSV